MLPKSAALCPPGSLIAASPLPGQGGAGDMMKTTALPSWRQALGVYLQPEVRVMLALGFAAGLPYLLIFSTLSAWLEERSEERRVGKGGRCRWSWDRSR